jgi:hypothetical protein
LSRLRRRTVHIFGFTAAVLVGLTTAVAIAADGVTPAPAGRPTYTFTGISVGPTLPTDKAIVTDAVDEGGLSVAVTARMTWRTNEWPGYAYCRVEVLDAAGEVIGAQEFEATSILRNPPATTMDVPLLETATSPASANIFCDEGRLPSGDAGYVLTSPEVSGTKDDPRLLFDVAWATDEPPMYQACEATLQRTDGLVGGYQFGLSTGPGEGEVLLTPQFAGAQVMGIACRPFTGQDGWGQ